MKLLLLCVLAVSPLFGAVDGVVINATTGKPQPSVIVTLVQPSQAGMTTIGSVRSDATGNFKIDKEISPGPALLQAIYQGAMYTVALPPGTPASGVRVDVFDSTQKPGTATLTERMILIEPSSSDLKVDEIVQFKNGSNLTFQDPVHGSLEFYLPPTAAGKVQVTIQGPGGMPIERPAEKTPQKDVYKVSYPLRPGETQFDVTYALPPSDTFSGRVVQKGTTRLVTASSVSLSGDSIEPLGQEPKTHARIWDLKSDSFAVKIEGTGSLRGPDSSAQSGDSDEDSGAPPVTEARARIYSKLDWVLGLTLAMLATGGTILFRKGRA